MGNDFLLFASVSVFAKTSLMREISPVYKTFLHGNILCINTLNFGQNWWLGD